MRQINNEPTINKNLTVESQESSCENTTLGEWITVDKYYIDEFGCQLIEAQCSKCNHYSTQNTTGECISYKYCPRCGAKMNV